MRLNCGLLLGAFLLAAGCAGPSRHLMNDAHPWHALPAKGVMLVGALPAIPVALVESALTGESFHGGVATPAFMLPAAGAGLLVGVVTYVVFFPLEFAFPLEDDPAPPRPPPPADESDENASTDPT